MIDSPLLPRFASYINGQWVADAPETISVRNPVNGQKLAEVPDVGGAGALSAVEAASRAMAYTPSLEQRRSWLLAIRDALLREKAQIARIITMEQGKPLNESVVEVEYAAGFFGYFASVMDHLGSRVLPDRIRGARWMVQHRPTGVVGLITPWNFPLAMLAKKLAPAIAAGCPSVTKPADLTPLTSIALWRLLEQIDMPRGFTNLVIGRPAPIGEVLCTHPDLRLISFTGSTEVGRRLIAATAPHVKRLALELGGNAPFVVMEDADLPAAAAALMANKFRCAGQTCVCANRVLVHRGVAESFAQIIAEKVAALRVGDGLIDGTDIGPLISSTAVEKVRQHVNDAISRGARPIAAAPLGLSLESVGTFFAPTVLDRLPPDARMLREETFGPVVAISEFDDEADAIAAANSTIYGLAAYVFTADTAAADRLVSALRFGHVGVNTGSGPTPEAPFGGMKQSGFGREGGIEGLMEFTEPQTVVRA